MRSAMARLAWGTGGAVLVALLAIGCGKADQGPRKAKGPKAGRALPADPHAGHDHGAAPDKHDPEAAHDEDDAEAAASRPTSAPTGHAQTACPVMDGKIDKKFFADYKGQRVYFCCAGCIEPFKKDPEKFVKKMKAAGVILAKAPK